MRFDTLDRWLAWQEGLHPQLIDLGLDRVAQVAQVMDVMRPASVVVTVGGTNGKGSCVALLAAILQAAGYRVGAYTSPHLLRYNERIRVCGADVTDSELCAAFQRVDDARGATSLTYFEFGTLAALDIFRRAALDVVILEVGLGGRLDAVNIVDADVALVASISLDHTQWLGHDREAIGFEKAGIFRAQRPAVCGDPNPPESIILRARALGAPLYCINRHFSVHADGQQWQWQGPTRRRDALPFPALRAVAQLDNAASVLMVLDLLRARLPVDQAAVRAGLEGVSLAARFQVWPGPVMRVLDVAHNEDSAKVLCATLSRQPCSGCTYAVVGMLADKDMAAVLRAMAPAVQAWYLGGLAVARGASGAQLAEALGASEGAAPSQVFATVAQAYAAACAAVRPGDRVVVFGSFHTVAEVLAHGV
jgi:dihydrofolate synthase / folylpolyglutamate synthase